MAYRLLPLALASFLLSASILISAAVGFDYGDALSKSLLFFEAQRSGKLPADQRVKWRGDSGLKDGFQQGVDLVGGYYDSGDHVKFGLPMAYTLTMLSWSLIEFEKEIAAADQLDYALHAIRWGTDYFIKAHKQPNLLWAQVGDGNSDHYCWERAEDMTTPRAAYKVDTENPGSDVAAETAAALAAASIAFRPYNSSYSQLLLLHARQLFVFADTFRGKYDESIPLVKEFYPSSGYDDELLWAAAWLFEATDEHEYLNYVVENSGSLGGTEWAVKEFSWDNKYAGLQILMAKVLIQGGAESYTTTLKQYQAKAEFFLCAILQKNNGYNVRLTPGGLLFIDEWNNMQYVSSSAFLMVVYAEYLSPNNSNLHCPDGQVTPNQILQFAQSQADYILGKNPKLMSYLVGYQEHYPINVHHRGASIESKSALPAVVGCIQGFDQWYDSKKGNPNVISGALVGGPDHQDQFVDQRSNYEQTEPAIVGNAPLIGLFAKLHTLSKGPGYVPKETKLYNPFTAIENPIVFFHSITNTWSDKGVEYYRHKVTVINKSGNPITNLKLAVENLSGPLWGLSSTREKNTYVLPAWLKVLYPNKQFVFVYVQGGLQAKVSVISHD
ncbi:endoglucanase 13 isoform X1 [Phalaenopsis equestris]|uniref:endoglucanase 13 isoform X1 n=1 Tax=Phalaenopsis equestris TaxID=78828 RepID=UPI0009E5F745|nr:endoglucanase 13 isoform X1 [Phalaenopsis equestris]